MSRQLCWRLAKYVSPYWEVLAFALAGMIVMAGTAPILAALVRPLLDGAIAGKDQEMLQLVLMGVAALFAVRGLAGYVATYSINWVGSKLMKDLRVEIFNKLLSLPARYFAFHSVGSLIYLVISSTDQVGRAFVALVTITVKDTFTVLGLLGWAFYLNWRLSAIALSMGAFILLIIRPMAARLEKMGPEMGQSVEGTTLVLKESVENYAAFKLYGGQRYESHRATEQAGEIHRFLMKGIGIAALSIPLWQMTIAVALGLIIYYAAQQLSADAITSGGCASVATALAMLSAPLRRIAGLSKSAQQGLAAGQSILSLLDEQAEPESGTALIARSRGELRFENISFADSLGQYREMSAEQVAKGYSVVREINLTVHSGEMVALVSFQESSITALANLVPLFCHPAGGKIFLDGQDLKSISLASLRANIAVVSVDAPLFNDTLAANIAYGDLSQATEARIMAAAYAAHVSEFARGLPEGMQTPVGMEDKPSPGLQLTSGQRLRIAVARALLKDSPVLILNETGEALDAESMPHVEAALDAVTRGRTTLVVARRLSTVKKANRVILLHKGRIAAIGTHIDLLATNEIYGRLARSFI